MFRPEEMEGWLRDKKARTVEERFGAEVILHHLHRQYYSKQGWRWELSYEDEHKAKKARRLNPAYKPKIDFDVVQRVASMALEVKHLHVSMHDDRPLKDISFIQFFPNITHLHVTDSSLQSIEPLRALTQFEELMISDHELEDFSPIESCVELRKLYLATYMSWATWPDFMKLPKLRFFNWRGNVLMLEEVKCFPALERAELATGYGSGTPLRDFRKVAEMPKLRGLKIEGIARLDGIERFPTLIDLEVHGRFRDLSPLRSLPNLTHLGVHRPDVVHTDLMLDVSPLKDLPELRALKVVTDQPIDFSPLAEAPKLHEIVREGWHVKDKNLNAMEVSTINAVLSPWADEFALPEPRPLGNLNFRVVEKPHELFMNPQRASALAVEMETNRKLFDSESGWFVGGLQKSLTKLLGKKWGSVLGGADPLITIASLEAAEQMPKIVEVVREHLARSRRERHAMLFVNIDAEWEGDAEEWDPDRELKQEMEERRSWMKEIAERKAYLERLHQVRLREQDGVSIDPAEFEQKEAPTPEQPEDTELDSDSGDVAMLASDKTEHPMADVLRSRLWVTLDTAYVSLDDQAPMEHLMQRKAAE